MPPFLVGDSVIVAVPLRNGGYDIQILTATEAGWDRDGEYWSDWMWDDVEYYIPLDGHRTGEEIP
jgi:hypothetical protein